MHVEAEFEAMLERVVPGCRSAWIGATPDEVESLERAVGRPLTPFHRWFLMRMGRDMGPLKNPRRAMDIATLLAIYRSEHFHPPLSSLVLIGSEHDPVMPMYVYYDLDRPTRQDASTCSFEKQGGPRQDEHETMREFVARMVFGRACIRGRHQCHCILKDSSRNVLDVLEPHLAALRFETIHRSGPRMGLYLRNNVALACRTTSTAPSMTSMSFTLAAHDETSVRSTLGALTAESSLEASHVRWFPPPRR